MKARTSCSSTCWRAWAIAQDAASPPRVGICESAAFFIYDGIKPLAPGYALENARAVTAYCRSRKSAAEIALMQRVMDMTLAVHVATASMLYEGITTVEVEEFIQRAHRKVGAHRARISASCCSAKRRPIRMA